MASRRSGGTHRASQSLDDFEEVSSIGEGAYSSVFKVCRKSDGKIYALKKVKLPNLTEKEKINALNEVRLLASVRHENVIAYKESLFDEASKCLCIITEYADGSDLFQKIVRHQKARQYIRESEIWHCVWGMTNGLKALHELQILHRDLKSANVFLTRRGDVKLGDFNVSKVAKRGLLYTQTGTPYYASPEVWKDMPYDAKSDVWSLGCVTYEMAALRPPFRADDMEGLYRKVLRGQYARIPACYSSDLSQLIALMLQVNPKQRPTVQQLLHSPLLQRHASHDPSVMSDLNKNPKQSSLLNTIQLPKGATGAELYKADLPLPRYDEDFPDALDGVLDGDVAGGSYPNSARDHRREEEERYEEYERKYEDYENRRDGRQRDQREQQRYHEERADAPQYEGRSKPPREDRHAQYRSRSHPDPPRDYADRGGPLLPAIDDDDRYVRAPQPPRRERRQPRSVGAAPRARDQGREQGRRQEHVLQSQQYQPQLPQHQYAGSHAQHAAYGVHGGHGGHGGHGAHGADNYSHGSYGAYAVPPYGRPQQYGHGGHGGQAAHKYRQAPSSHGGSQRSHVRAAHQALGVGPLGAGGGQPPPLYNAGNYNARPHAHRLPGGYHQSSGGAQPPKPGGQYSINNLKLPSLGPSAHRVGDARGHGGHPAGSPGVDYRPALPPLLERN